MNLIKGILGILVILFITIISLVIWNKKSQPSYLIGISTWGDNEEYLQAIKGFKAGLKEDGFIQGKNIQYIEKNPNMDPKKQANFIQVFINRHVNLIFTLTTPGTLIAKDKTNKIPIVFSVVTYPVETGIIHSLQFSQNNLVGTRNYIPPEEQIYFYKLAYPQIKNLAFAHHANEPNSDIQFKEFKQYLELFNINTIGIAATDLNDLSSKLNAFHGKFDSIYSACDTLIQKGGEEIIIKYANRYKIPNFTCNKNDILKGALIGYVSDTYSIGKLAGHKAAAILNGSKPKWLLTESPKKGLLFINKTTAKKLGIVFPKTVLQEADFIVGK